MTISRTFEALGSSVPAPFHTMDPHSYLRLKLPVLSGQGELLGKVDALEHDPATGQLTAIVVRHGLLWRRRTRISAERVKWVNQDSLIVDYSQSAFQRLPVV